MAIKPILFNTEMVRAILDGRKTCTRRVVKPQWEECPTCKYVHNEYIYDNIAENVYCARCGYPMEPERRSLYQPGDILYVRETIWQKTGHYLDVDGETKAVWCNEFKYVASDEKPETGWNYSWARRPSIHMPKEAARIWLKVTDVRVERLQEINEKQACMEGTDPWDEACYENNGWHPTFSDPDSGGDPNMIEGFHKLWNSTIKKSDLDRYGWDANPWVWVIEFERCEKPKGV